MAGTDSLVLIWSFLCYSSVKTGVDHFKSRRFVDAMNEYNKALEIDTNNVEALVARGALWVTIIFKNIVYIWFCHITWQ